MGGVVQVLLDPKLTTILFVVHRFKSIPSRVKLPPIKSSTNI